MQNTTDTKPNGPVAAAFLAGGIGCFVFGVLVTAAAASADFGKTLDFAKNYGIGSGVGPLSGKAIVAVVAFFAAWVVSHIVLRGKEVDFNKFFIASLVLVGLGFALTFPPIYDAVAPK